ncbi:hypothetical protein AJ80_03498 [Polytolypa hystricis UAMH7299]|uniref:Developmental regulatory protein wetA n=1 Tax=Polytolypa hystricis (strain UAMH7299) TaxID=1447883 RepID=A0A2B7YIQ2_POLH7|nr:hypothetical protein AJ80_03498 [Polytolypa hystricis UAMH7299]
MHSPMHSHPAVDYSNQWSNRFDHFDLHGPTNNPRLSMSAQSSPNLVHHATMGRIVEPTSDPHSNHIVRESTPVQIRRYEPDLTSRPQSMSMSPPNPSPDMRQRYLDQPTPLPTPPAQPPASHILRSQKSESPQMPSWPAETIDASIFQYTASGMPAPDNQSWWPPQAIPARDMQPYSQSAYQPMVMTPVPQRPNPPAGTMQDSLMLQFDSPVDMPSVTQSPLPGSAASCPEPIVQSPYNQLAASRDIQSAAPSFDLHLQRHFTPPSHNQPVSPASAASPGPSLRAPSTSAFHRSPKSRQHPHHNHHYHQQYQRRSHIRKSSSLSGNLSKGIKSSSNSNSSSSGPKAPITVSFVNFTPEDSHKLLTGVAPSGSSKTKARREQEAREKRRKLSEAALMAVRRAGGDIESLEAVLC